MPPIDSILTSGKRFHNNAYGKFVAESQNFIKKGKKVPFIASALSGSRDERGAR